MSGFGIYAWTIWYFPSRVSNIHIHVIDVARDPRQQAISHKRSDARYMQLQSTRPWQEQLLPVCDWLKCQPKKDRSRMCVPKMEELSEQQPSDCCEECGNCSLLRGSSFQHLRSAPQLIKSFSSEKRITGCVAWHLLTWAGHCTSFGESIIQPTRVVCPIVLARAILVH